MSRIEHADGDRNGTPFPSSWGPPRGTPGTEERATWVMNKVRRLVLDRKMTSDPGLREALLDRKLASDPRLREALLERKRFGP